MFNLQKEAMYVLHEILRFKRQASIVSGCEVDTEFAAREWIDRYYGEWFKAYKNKFMENH